MGQKKPKGTVSIQNAAGRIRLRWRYHSKRYSLNLGHYCKVNLVEAKKVALQVERDLLCQTFDITLTSYQNNKQLKEIVSEELNLVKLFEQWVKEYRQLSCEVNTDYYQVRNLLKRWGQVQENTLLDFLNKESYSPKTYNGRLSILKKFSAWLQKNNIWKTNPLEDVFPRKKKNTVREDRKPFTQTEIQTILDAFKTNRFCSKSSRYPHSFYYPFLYFLFKTGCRPAEVIGLRVSSIDFSRKLVIIREAMARTVKGTHAAVRIRKETKTGVERMIPLTDDLYELLKPIVSSKQKDDLVFLSFNGLPIDDRMFQKRVFKPTLSKLGVSHRVLYACRHTFSSRCIDEGITPVMTAFLMGNHPQTALRNYTHQVSIPKMLPDIF